MLPKDGNISLSLAGLLLTDGNIERAARMFEAVAEQHGTALAWSGTATALHLLERRDEAQGALAALLACSVMTDVVRALATAIKGVDWCGLTLDGMLWVGPGKADRVRIDGRVVELQWTRGRARLPTGWQSAGTISVEYAGQALLGSPIPVRDIVAIEGMVESLPDGGVQGWAWYPADPDRPPELLISGPFGERTIQATKPAEVKLDRPIARPRQFEVPPSMVAELGSPLAVRGLGGRHLLGSPLDPGLEARAAADPARAGFSPVWADVVGVPARGSLKLRSVAVVIPVFQGRVETLACLDSVLASVGRGTRIIVVDDASPDSALIDALRALARQRRIALVRLPENKGFPGAANAGIAAAGTLDVVLLNSDTLVPPGWLERLQAAAYSAPNIATVSPLSNDATILSYPNPDGGNLVPNLAETVTLDALAHRANGANTVDIPVGVGFCLYLRRECLDFVGTLREDLFAQGYGEENDLCLRARHAGWRNVAAPGVFVAHVGATSFGGARLHLIRRNTSILNRLHPGYDALVARHLADDPLAPARHRMDLLRWAARRKRAGALVMITHAGGGGVERVVQERAAVAIAKKQRAIVLRPTGAGAASMVQVEELGAHFPNLVFAMPGDLDALTRLLKADKPARVELHHMLGHAAELAGLAGRLGCSWVSVIHDYARFCPRIALVSTARRYCGEPEVKGCEACIADLGSLLEDDPPVRTLLERSAAELGLASQVIVPSADAAVRIARHFPGVRPVVEHWEDDRPMLQPMVPGSRVLRVVVVGGIGIEKGFDVLLACVRDAKERRLPLEFVVVGYTMDDERLMAAGPAFITGEFAEEDAVALIRAQRGHVAFIPSVWPETWCFALGRAWQAGLPAVVFDLGAQAERVRTTGAGTVLPLGLGAPAVNEALLRMMVRQAEPISLPSNPARPITPPARAGR